MSILFVKLSLPSRINLIAKLSERIPIRITSNEPNEMMDSIHYSINQVRRKEGLKVAYQTLNIFKMFAITSYHNLYYHQDPRCQICDCTPEVLEQLETVDVELKDFNLSSNSDDSAPNPGCSSETVSSSKTRKNKKKRRKAVTNSNIDPSALSIIDESANVLLTQQPSSVAVDTLCDVVPEIEDVVQCFADSVLTESNNLDSLPEHHTPDSPISSTDDTVRTEGALPYVYESEPPPASLDCDAELSPDQLAERLTFRHVVRRMLNALVKYPSSGITELLCSDSLTNTKMRKLSNYIYRANVTSGSLGKLRARFIYLAVRVGYQPVLSN